MTTTALIPRATLEDLIRERETALRMYREALVIFVQAKTHHRTACPQGNSISLPTDLGNVYLHDNSVEDKMAEITKCLDRDMWQTLLTHTPLWSLMDREEREKFEHSIQTDPPPVTLDAVESTLARLSDQKDVIFRRGLVTAFQELNRDYKSHDGFKLGDRIILEYAVEYSQWGDFSTYYRREDKLRDVDRVMHVLDGLEAPDYQEGLCAEIRRLCREYKTTGETELHTPYWKVRIFKNGNAHLYPLQKDLIDKANRLIAEHYGLVLADGNATNPGVRWQKQVYPGGDFGDFPSPMPVVKKVMELADIQPGDFVLEPSAGAGNLACEAQAAGALVDCVEYQAKHVKTLEATGLFRSVAKRHFLEYPTPAVYTKVIMNPPFSRKADILHVMHAWKGVKPGGRLVSVMSAGALTGTHSLNGEIIKLIDQYGHFEHLPDGSFEESGTSVRTVVIVLNKPGGDDGND